MKKLVIIVMCVLLALCGMACTATAAPVEAADATTESADVPAAVADAPEASEAGEFAGINVVWLGGSTTDTFTESVRKGVELAEKLLGCNVEYLYTDWDAGKTVELLSQTVARNDVNVISLVGMAPDDAIQEYVEAGLAKGIVITGYNSINERMVDEHLAEGFGYVGADLYGSGHTVGVQAALRSGAAAGSKALVMGYLGESGTRGERTQGIIDGLEENSIEVDYIELSTEAKADCTQATPTIVSYLSSNPDTAILIIDGGSHTAMMQSYLETAGYEPGQIFCAGFDISEGAIAGIQNGYLNFLLDQQQYLQGFYPILNGCLTYKYGFSGFNIDTGAAIIDITNAAETAELASLGIR